jgi:alkanesulfonate monooxygenase SsuD/methylene tetrahydromethanopterin reductase-like flavin-dependent oxidoreductase (luciferase family)
MRKETQPPTDDIESYWTPGEKQQVQQMLACSIVGSPETIRSGITALLDRTDADELMVVSETHDFAKRLRSFEIIADVVARRL